MIQLFSKRRRLLLDDVPWETYEGFLKKYDERRIRITYDRGSLEIMTLSFPHEKLKHLLGLLIVALAEEWDQPIAGGGSVTMKRRDKKRGLEPDECFWIQNEARMRGKKKYDLRRDPPPDLALEIDVSRSSLDRISIYAALGVPEIWRWRRGRLEVYLLDKENLYQEDKSSTAFPGFHPGKLLDFLALEETQGEIGLLKAFRVWVRKKIRKN